MQYLLWICFGLLAVVPWQMICGQETTNQARSGSGEIEWLTDSDLVSANAPSLAKPKKRQRLERLSRSNSLIFRSQSADIPPSPSSPGSMPYELSPISPAGPSGSGPSSDYEFLGSDVLTGRSGRAYGAKYSGSFITGPAIGRQHDIIPIEMMPYAFLDNSVFFGDIRGFTTTNPSGGGFGMNLGGGYRFYMPRFDRILGVNAYYDYDNSSGALFREVGFGAESLGALWDVRANAYLPTGSSSQQLGLSNINGTQVFSGHYLLVDQAKLLANALRGFDAEIGVPLPGRIALRHDVRVFGGGYSFEGDQISQFAGWKLKATGNVTPNILLNLQVSNDPQFHTNVVFGATWTFGGFRQSEDERKTQYDRMTAPVQRQYNMVVGLTTEVIKGVTVINPATNLPYFFEHVSNNSTNPITGIHDGTVEHPWLTLPDAQTVAQANDIIFVHGNSSYTGVAVNLQQDIRVLGESTGVEHLVATDAGNLLLPHPTAAPAVAPIFANSPTDGVTLANNSEFSGFTVTGAAGYGINGTNVSNVTLREDTVGGSVNSTVLLSGTSGTITMLGDTINDSSTASATTFLVQGTTGTITFSQDPLSTQTSANGTPIEAAGTINNVVGTGGRALQVNNTAAGSVVNFTGSTINDTTGNGILIENNSGTVSLGDANVTNGLGIGIDFLNNIGTMIGNGTLDVTNSAGDSIVIQGTPAGGNVFFTDPGTTGTGAAAAGINITNRQARGIYLEGNAGNTTFSTPVSIAASSVIPQAAIDYQGNSGNATFNNTIAINGGGPGILIGNATGTPVPNTGFFTVNGNTTITNTAGIGIDVLDDKSTVSFSGGVANTLTINQRGDIGIQVLDNLGSVSFGGTTTVNNQNAATVPGVNIQGNNVTAAAVSFNTLNIQNARGTGIVAPTSGIGLNIGGTATADFNAASVTINNLNIGNNGAATLGTALYVNNEGTITGSTLQGLTIGSGTINSQTGQAIDIENTTMRVSFSSVSSQNSPTNGITLINDQSFTPLPNNVTAPLLNDYMFQILGNTAAVLRNGGIIQGSAGDGIFINQTAARLFQTGDVNLNQIQLQTNQNGLVANNLLQLQMTNSEINQNVHTGLIGTSIPSVSIFTSYFDLNGTTLADNAIHLTANATLLTTNRTAGGYLWTIENNNTTSAGIAAGFFGAVGTGSLVAVDSGGTTLKVQTTSTLTTVTPLVFNYVNNTTLMQPGPTPVAGQVLGATISAVAVNWTGFESGNINDNTFTLRGYDQAIGITNTDATYLTNFDILGNTITTTGGGNFGIFVNNNGPTDLTIGTYVNDGISTQNNFTFTTPNAQVGGVNNSDIGMSISVLNSTTTASLISLTDNIITMTGASNDQGVVFPLLQGAAPGPTTINLSNNNISVNILPNAAFNGQGIDFQSILGTINLEGALSNTVTINGTNTIPNGAGVTTADWVILPAATNTRTGSFYVNGLIVR